MSKPVRITFVALNYPPSRGGAQEHVRRLAEGLVTRGHQVTVLTTDSLRSPSARHPGHIDVAEETVAGVEVHRYRTPRVIQGLQRVGRMVRGRIQGRRSDRPAGPVGPWLIGPWSPGLIRAVWRATRSADVVIGSSAPFSTVLLPAWFRSADGARIGAMPLLHLSGSEPHPSVLRALRRCDLVFASTEFEAEADRSFGVDPAKVAVIPPGVSGREFTPMDAADARHVAGLPEQPTVGFIGRLAAYKGVDTLLEAAPLLWAAHPDATVLIAGSPAGWDGYRTAVSEEQSKGRLIIREGFSDDERSALLSACDVVVHPSREESFGLIALEAWAAHRPVVLGDIPCVRSFVRPGVTAELVAPGDAAGLAAILGQLLDQPAQRDRLAAVGHAEIAARFDWERVVDAWDDVLTRATGGGR